MLKLFKTNRCNGCYTERAVRECPRKKHKTCWQCCNNLRYDARCPQSCPYAPREVENTVFPSFKADSRQEAEQVLKLYTDLWIVKQNKHLEMQTPEHFAKEKPKELLSWLSGYQYPAGFPIEYLMEKLGLKHQPAAPLDDPETVVEQYFNAIIQLQWDKLHPLSINTSQITDFAERYTELLQGIPILHKVNSYSVLHSGLGDDGRSAIVFVELNHKLDWTLVLSRHTTSSKTDTSPQTEEWRIRQNIAGSPQLFFNQNKAHSAIAEALGKAEDDKAWDLLTNAFKDYPDSADLYYYRALYWQLVKQQDKATVDFFNALALDNAWAEPYFHLGAIYLGKQDYAQAQMWFAELVALQPDNPNAVNNLAAAYAGSGNTEKAREIWQGMLRQFPGFELAKQNLEKL